MTNMDTQGANARQVGGTHYAASYQHWDLVADAGLGYFEAQITKYIGRARKKNGRQDVEKSGHFTQKMTELFNAGRYLPHHRKATPGMVTRYCAANDLSEVEQRITTLICFWQNTDQLDEAAELIAELLKGPTL